MTLLPINQYGDKILRKKAQPVKKGDPELVAFVKNMFETMHNAMGVGLAANQVGSNKAVFIVDISVMKEYPNEKPRVFVNPKIIERSEEKISYEEGCLSIPDVRADVVRPKKIKIAFQDLEQNEMVLEFDDFLARVIQHEYDHLQGVFFTDRISEWEQKKIKKDLIKIKNRKIEVDYPVTEREKD
ncbi:MAG: peptide deformylase [Ignavibacteriaceae bacterium]|nr:MAG: peptide deformylase [Ignavibacteriaceae bacterium]MBW7872956.1 peptide deformylase [Ignavibacteria bacterium]MBZ0196413.1 peptide deformylase [Ignavibacteriaceae bacterium]OQY73589.1 MAG: peptide deformylase [Ignavibacteriales bacterium UTCHB3]